MFRQSLWSLAATLAFSVMAAFVRLCSDEFSAQELVFYRSAFGAVVVYFITVGCGYSIKTRYPRQHFVRSFLGICSICIWFYALGRMPFGTCMTLSYTGPLFLAASFIVLSVILHTRAPWTLIVTICIGFLGIVLVMRPSTQDVPLIPALLCLSTGVLEVPIKWQMKLMGNLKEPSYRIVFYFCFLGTLMSGVFTLLTTGFHVPKTTSLLGLFGVMVCATLGQLTMTRSIAYGNLLLSSCLTFLAIPFSALIGFFFFEESTDLVSLLGMSIIIVAGVIASVHTRTEEKRLKQNEKEKADGNYR